MKRSEVDKSLTWDISDIFKTEDDFKKALIEVEENQKKLKRFIKELNGYCTINTCLEDLNDIYVLIDLLANYASLGL